jgi:hypothetical protein
MEISEHRRRKYTSTRTSLGRLRIDEIDEEQVQEMLLEENENTQSEFETSDINYLPSRIQNYNS